jgi:hypothetical protein
MDFPLCVRSYSLVLQVQTEIEPLQQASSLTRSEFVSLEQLFLTPLLEQPPLCSNWLIPLSVCRDVKDAFIVDSQRAAILLCLPPNRLQKLPCIPAQKLAKIMAHADSLWTSNQSSQSASFFEIQENFSHSKLRSKRNAPDSRAKAWCCCITPSRRKNDVALYAVISPLPTAALDARLCAVALVQGKEHEDAGTQDAVWQGADAERRVNPAVWDALDALAQASASAFPGDVPLLPRVDAQEHLHKSSLQSEPAHSKGSAASKAPTSAPRARKYKQSQSPVPPEHLYSSTGPSQLQNSAGPPQLYNSAGPTQPQLVPRPPAAMRAPSPAAALRGSLRTASLKVCTLSSVSCSSDFGLLTMFRCLVYIMLPYLYTHESISD